jgi:PhnB protein
MFGSRLARWYGANFTESLAMITAHIVVNGAAAAADWYKRALGAEERGHRIALPNGKHIHIELRIGGSAVMVADEFPDMGVVSPRTVGGTSVVLAIATDAADTMWNRAIEAGATVVHPLGEMFWGDRQGQFDDPFGHRWSLVQHVRDVPPEDVARAAAKAFGVA